MPKYECQINVPHDCGIKEHKCDEDCKTYQQYMTHYKPFWELKGDNKKITETMDAYIFARGVENASDEKYPFSGSVEVHGQAINLDISTENNEETNLDSELINMAKLKFISYGDIEDIRSGSLNPLSILSDKEIEENSIMAEALFEDKRRRFQKVWNIVQKKCSEVEKKVVDIAIDQIIVDEHINQTEIAKELRISQPAVFKTLKRVQKHLPPELRDYLHKLQTEKSTTERLLSSNWRAGKGWDARKQKGNAKLQEKAIRNLFYHEGY